MFWNGTGIAICCPIALQTDLLNIANGDDPSPGGGIYSALPGHRKTPFRASHRIASLRRFEPCPDMPKKILWTVGMS
jgi:hypothetical protein